MNTITQELMNKIKASGGIYDTKTYRYWYISDTEVKRVRVELLDTTATCDDPWEYLTVKPSRNNQIAHLRTKADLTQQGLANAAGIHIRMVQKLEGGEANPENITLKVAVALAKALGVTVEDLLL